MNKTGGCYGFVRVTMGHIPALVVGLSEAMVSTPARVFQRRRSQIYPRIGLCICYCSVDISGCFINNNNGFVTPLRRANCLSIDGFLNVM
jgi:hypothetical protein